MRFVPVLYFMQALPVALVTELSLTIYKSLGLADGDIARWTSLIGLPWSIKFLWGPLVELSSTKRKWLLIMQALIVLGLLGAAFAIQSENFFGITLAIFATIAIFSATCDIATDGFYLLSTRREEQSKFVGFQSTFFRLGRLFATALIVMISGKLINGEITGTPMPPNQAWSIGLFLMAGVYLLGRLFNPILMPTPEADVERKLPEGEAGQNFVRLGSLVATGGFLYYGAGAIARLIGAGLSSMGIQAEKWKPVETDLYFIFVKFAEKVPGIQAELINLTIAVIGALVLGSVAKRSLHNTEIKTALTTFFGQAAIARILAFLLFYRFGEAMLGRIVPLFLQDTKTGPEDITNGLGFAVDVVGQVNGVYGVVGIVVGGIVGGIFVSRVGIRRSFWPLAAAMNLPNLLYIWAASARPGPQPMSVVMFVDQFGYGFGFAGYFVALMYIAQQNPNYRTAHYAIGTGLGATFIALAGILSAALIDNLDYGPVFWIVLCFTFPCLLTILLLPKDILEAKGAEVGAVDVE